MDLTPLREDWPRTPWNRPGLLVLSDDPADHGLGEVEVACIEKAYEIRRREVRAALKQSPQSDRSGSAPRYSRPTNVREWLLWIFVMPLFYAAILLMKVVLGPLECLSDRRDVARRKSRLRQELAELERPPLLQPIEGKTLWDLWRIYGFERDRFDESAGVELAHAWLERLYGADTRQALDLEARLEAVNRRRAEYRANATNVTCILFTPRLEEVLRELSMELPPYDWAGSAQAPQPTERMH